MNALGPRDEDDPAEDLQDNGDREDQFWQGQDDTDEWQEQRNWGDDQEDE